MVKNTSDDARLDALERRVVDLKKGQNDIKSIIQDMKLQLQEFKESIIEGFLIDLKDEIRSMVGLLEPLSPAESINMARKQDVLLEMVQQREKGFKITQEDEGKEHVQSVVVGASSSRNHLNMGILPPPVTNRGDGENTKGPRFDFPKLEGTEHRGNKNTGSHSCNQITTTPPAVSNSCNKITTTPPAFFFAAMVKNETNCGVRSKSSEHRDESGNERGRSRRRIRSKIHSLNVNDFVTRTFDPGGSSIAKKELSIEPDQSVHKTLIKMVNNLKNNDDRLERLERPQFRRWRHKLHLSRTMEAGALSYSPQLTIERVSKSSSTLFRSYFSTVPTVSPSQVRNFKNILTSRL